MIRSRPEHADASLLDQLGNTGELTALFKFKYPSRVANWRSNGVPWEFRARVKNLCKKAGVEVPKNFLGEEG